MSKALQHGYYRIGENKGSPRIWLQGGNLEASNFTKSTSYTITYLPEKQMIVLAVVPVMVSGARVVSGRVKKNGYFTPIIDLNSLESLGGIAGAERVRADFHPNVIYISVHHLDEKRHERERRFIDHISRGYLEKGVLCCGIGMSAAAGHDALLHMGINCDTRFVIDRERKYLDVADKNNHALSRDTLIVEASLEEVETDLLDSIDLLSFSLPCTGMGSAGKAKNKITYAEEHATDALAIIGLLRIIDAKQPSVLVSENVVGAMNSATYILLKSMLSASGYNVTEVVLNSDDTGSIENRERYWFVATSEGLPTVDLTQFPYFDTEFSCLGDLLEDIPAESSAWTSTAEKIRKAEVNKLAGKGFGFNLVDGSAKRIGVCGKGYQKNRATEPHIAGENDTMRLLTPTELCRSQSAPLHLISNCIDGIAYEGLGQGIDYRQGYGVFQKIASDVCYPYLLNSIHRKAG